MGKRTNALAAALALLCLTATADTHVILDMDTLKHKAPKAKGQQEVVEGKFGKAVKFAFEENSVNTFFTNWVNPKVNWDEYKGMSFWVKGDGSANYGGIELIDETYRCRFGYAFALKDTEWHKVTVPWCDFIPETPVAGLMPPYGDFKPSKVRNIWVGKWHYWGKYPAHSFSLDQFGLEKEIAATDNDYVPAASGLPKTIALLKARKPITIVTVGDSLTDANHWANKEDNWPKMLQADLKTIYGSEITICDVAIGGTQLSQGIVLTGPNIVDNNPNLVTICYGYNDWDGGMRGDAFRKYLEMSVDQIRRKTNGKAEILLMTSSPAASRWTDMKELGEAVRQVAKSKKTGLVDIEKAIYEAGRHKQDHLFVRDRTHLSQTGHRVFAAAVIKAIKAGAKAE